MRSTAKVLMPWLMFTELTRLRRRIHILILNRRFVPDFHWWIGCESCSCNMIQLLSLSYPSPLSSFTSPSRVVLDHMTLHVVLLLLFFFLLRSITLIEFPASLMFQVAGRSCVTQQESIPPPLWFSFFSHYFIVWFIYFGGVNFFKNIPVIWNWTIIFHLLLMEWK